MQNESNEELLFRAMIEYMRENNKSVRLLFESYDKDRDSFLNFKEFKELAIKFNKRFKDAEIKQVFTKLDIDEDFQLNFFEFHKAVTEFDEAVYNEVLEAIKQYLKDANVRAIVLFR